MPTIFFKKISNLVAISASSNWQPTDAQLTEDEIGAYAPFNVITAYNNSDKDAEIHFAGYDAAGKKVEYFPAGSTLIFDKEENIVFERPTIRNTNSSNAIAIGDIILEIRKVI